MNFTFAYLLLYFGLFNLTQVDAYDGSGKSGDFRAFLEIRTRMAISQDSLGSRIAVLNRQTSYSHCELPRLRAFFSSLKPL